MDSRLCYLLTRLPPLPPLGETLPIALEDALQLLRQQGGKDLELLAAVLGVEALLRESLDEWVLDQPGSRTVPAGLPTPLRKLFDEETATVMSEETWVEAVWDSYLALLHGTGLRIGSRLLPRWTAWERALRRGLARRRARLMSDREAPGRPEKAAPDGDPGPEAVLAAWSAARPPGGGLAAAMAAEVALDGARLAFLETETPRYSFTLDELVAYVLRLRLLERHRRLDRQRGRALLAEVAAP